MSRMPKSPPSRAQRYRAALRARGLRPIQIWVPDTRAPGFAAEAARQCRIVNAADQQDNIMEWLETVSEFDDNDASG